ncbi:RNA-directed DNA polymerase, eukaryota [Artemisia annua]|uniref:RNA-directed DNA polymerase, eukaryota n=1 Tax=Artemisia annua TaxID=35608 RepID=A0A2U1LP02_ARTAN|nr:RNA-directed DNA polymerase, eukaryota [Artemisia annua]
MLQRVTNLTWVRVLDQPIIFAPVSLQCFQSRHNIQGIVQILQCFQKVSGLTINLLKSNLFGVGIPFADVQNLAMLTGCQALNFPFTYLGLPIYSNMSRCKGWDPIIQKFTRRLSKWKANLLSIGGRSTLITSVLGTLERLSLLWIYNRCSLSNLKGFGWVSSPRGAIV